MFVEDVWVRLVRLEEISASLVELVVRLERDVQDWLFGERIGRVEADIELLLQNQVKLVNLLIRSVKGVDIVDGEQLVSMQSDAASLVGLAPTELRALKVLSAGPTSAPDIGRSLGRSREHAARLMNKLFREGYVERRTDKIPYVYSLIDSIKSVVSERLGS